MEENVEVQVARRRRHSAEFKSQAVSACMQPGVSIAAVALRYRLNANLLRRWLAAHEEQIAAPALSRAAIPAAEFLPLPLCNAKSNEESQDIVVELRRGATIVTLRWPVSAAGECAQWLQGWLR